MLTVYTPMQDGLRKVDGSSLAFVPPDAIWLDLFIPTADEERLLEQALGIEVPTLEEMQEIEVSSRLYKENGAIYLTASVLAGTESERPQSAAITFVLIGERLLTLRYADPKPFLTFTQRVQRPGSGYGHAHTVLAGLLDTVISRAADILERIGTGLDDLSFIVFQHPDNQPAQGRDFQDILRQLGQRGDLISKANESLVSLERLLGFLHQTTEETRFNRELRGRLKTMSRDVQSLIDHTAFLANKINLLLDATLGMINIEQNAIIKIFSIGAVMFLPPTLIASIYGMNFHFMPELDWSWGYPLALILMVISALLPFLYFKRRGWL